MYGNDEMKEVDDVCIYSCTTWCQVSLKVWVWVDVINNKGQSYMTVTQIISNPYWLTSSMLCILYLLPICVCVLENLKLLFTFLCVHVWKCTGPRRTSRNKINNMQKNVPSPKCLGYRNNVLMSNNVHLASQYLNLQLFRMKRHGFIEGTSSRYQQVMCFHIIHLWLNKSDDHLWRSGSFCFLYNM